MPKFVITQGGFITTDNQGERVRLAPGDTVELSDKDAALFLAEKSVIPMEEAAAKTAADSAAKLAYAKTLGEAKLAKK